MENLPSSLVEIDTSTNDKIPTGEKKFRTFFAKLDLDKNDTTDEMFNIVDDDLKEKVINAINSKKNQPLDDVVNLVDDHDDNDDDKESNISCIVLDSSSDELDKKEEKDDDGPIANECNQVQNVDDFEDDEDLPLVNIISNKNKSNVLNSSESDTETDIEEESDLRISNSIDWCICKNRTHNDSTKNCDNCKQWYHITCVGDEETKKKLETEKVSNIDFVCLICRNDKELMKKFDSNLINMRIKQLTNSSESDHEENKSKQNNDKLKSKQTSNYLQAIKTFEEELETYSSSSSDSEWEAFRKKSNKSKKLISPTGSAPVAKLVSQNKPSPKPDSTSNINKKNLSVSTGSPSLSNSHKSLTTKETKKTEIFSFTKLPNRPTSSITVESTSKQTTSKQKPEERKTKLIEPPKSIKNKHHTPPTYHRIETKNIIYTSDYRDHSKSVLINLFEKRIHESNDETKISPSDLESVCVEIEQAFFELFGRDRKNYNKNLKILALNIADKNNHTFYRKILNGQIKPAELPRIDKEKMKDDDLRKMDQARKNLIINGYVQQSNDINEDMRLRQESLKNKKGLDDDLSNLGNFSNKNTDLNNNNSSSKHNDKEANNTKHTDEIPNSLITPSELFSNKDTTNQHGKHDFDVACKICTGQQASVSNFSNSVQTEPIKNFPNQTSQKRKHDSDFESDSESEEANPSKLTKMTPNIEKNNAPSTPIINVSSSSTSTSTSTSNSNPNTNTSTNSGSNSSSNSLDIIKNIFLTKPAPIPKINHYFWAGSLKIDLNKTLYKLNVTSKCVNDLESNNIDKTVKESIPKIKEALSCINSFSAKQSSLPTSEIWKMLNNRKSFVCIKFEADSSSVSFRHEKDVKNGLNVDSNQLYDELFDKFTSSEFCYRIDLSDLLSAYRVEYLYLNSLKRKDPNNEDQNLKEKYSVKIQRDRNYLIGLITFKPVSTNPELPNQLVSENTNIINQKRKNQSENISNLIQHKKIVSKLNTHAIPETVSKLSPKITEQSKTLIRDPRIRHKSNEIENEQSVLDEVKQQHQSSNTETSAENHKTISLDEYKKSRIKQNQEQEQTNNEQQNELIEDNLNLIRFLINSIVYKLHLPDYKLKEAVDHLTCMSQFKLLTEKERESLKQEFANKYPEFMNMLFPGSNEIDSKNQLTSKLSLPPTHLWQGPSKESFNELLKIHKHSQEQKKKGNPHDLTYENKKWTLEKKDFKQLDQSLLGASSIQEKEKEEEEGELEEDDITNEKSEIRKTEANKNNHRSGSVSSDLDDDYFRPNFNHNTDKKKSNSTRKVHSVKDNLYSDSYARSSSNCSSTWRYRNEKENETDSDNYYNKYKNNHNNNKNYNKYSKDKHFNK